MMQAGMASTQAAFNATNASGPWNMPPRTPNPTIQQPPPIPPEAMMKKESSIMKGLKK